MVVENNGKKILIVDDDQSILQTLKLILQSEGYTVETAETGGEAIEKSKAQQYNLALLDIRLPDMEGTRLLTKMRSGTPRMRRIMITGYSSLENALESLNNGADAYIEKPIQPRQLLNIIKDKLHDQELEQYVTVTEQSVQITSP